MNSKRFKLWILVLGLGLLLTALSACSYGSHLDQQDKIISEITKEITSLESDLSNTDAALIKREAELESIKFELGILRKEVLEIRSPTLNPEQSQTEQMSKLIQELSSPNCDTNKLAFELRKFGKRAVMSLMEALKKPEQDYRNRVEKVFSGLLADDASSFLQGALKDPAIRNSAARILGEMKDSSAANTLTEYIASDDDDFAFEVSEALVKMQDKRGIPTLIDYLKRPDINKRAIAFNLLTKITDLTLDYKYYGTAAEVSVGAKRWSDWWVKNASTFIFPNETGINSGHINK